jgi:hypothetical protein
MLQLKRADKTIKSLGLMYHSGEIVSEANRPEETLVTINAHAAAAKLDLDHSGPRALRRR